MYRSRKYWIGLVLFSLIRIMSVKASDTLTTENVETYSLKLYNEKNWKELIRFTDLAINESFDYYYIRMRAGIACYETKKYRKAESHFKKALSFNTGDEDATSYLYYCLIYNEKYEEAKWFSKSFSEGIANKLMTNKKVPFTYIASEGGIKTTTATDTFNTGQYYQLGLEHYLFHRISFFHSFNFYQQTISNSFPKLDTVSFFRYHQLPGPPDSSVYFNNQLMKTTGIQQYHYFLKANIPLKANFLLSFSGQWIYEVNKVNSTSYTISGMEPEHQDHGQNIPAHTIQRTFPGRDTVLSNSSYIASSSIKKCGSFLDYSIGALINSIGPDVEYQFNAGIEYHPFANNNFVLGIIGYRHSRNDFSENVFAFSPYLLAAPFKKVAVTVDFMHNQAGNVVEYSGFYVNNSKYFIQNRLGVTLKYQLFKKVSIYGNYGLEYKGDKDNSEFKFKDNMFLLGIAITP